MNLLDILKVIWSGKQGGQQNPYLTPGWNGQPNPMDQIPGRQQTGVPMQQQSQMPQQQSGMSGGISGLLQNPNFLQGIAQIAMSQGTYGGARGLGFQNAMNSNRQMQMEQAANADQSAREWERIRMGGEQRKDAQATAKSAKISQLVNAAQSMGVSIGEAAALYGMEVDPELASKLDTAIANKKKSTQTYIDVDPQSETYGQIIASPDPENPNHYPMDTKTAVQLSKSLTGKKGGEKFYVGSNGKLIPESYLANIPTEARMALEGPFDAQQAISRAGQVNGSKNYQDVEISDSKGGHKSALFDPKAGAYIDPDTKQVIPGAKRYYQPSASIQIARGQDPEIYADMLAKGAIKPAEVPQAIRDKALSIATKNGAEILSDTEREKLTNYKKIEPVIQSISDLSEKINTGQGVVAKATGLAEKAKAKMNLDDDVAEYQSLISGFTPLIARAVGHTGVLTEQDVASVKEMFPKPGDSKALRDRKIARLKFIMGGVQEATRASTTEPIPSSGGKPASSTGNAEADEFLKKKGIQ